jgi:hypothetical protein
MLGQRNLLAVGGENGQSSVVGSIQQGFGSVPNDEPTLVGDSQNLARTPVQKTIYGEHFKAQR